MAKTQTEAPEIDQQTLMARMVDVLEKLGSNQKPYEPGFGDPAYQARLKDEGFFDLFTIPVFQNGRECEPRGLSEQTRERACKLKAGTYLGGKVMVECNGRSVHLKYKSMTVEDRMRTSALFTSFPDLIDKIWAEMHPES